MKTLTSTPETALSTENSFPILYSFRRCPYAMRARIAIVMAQVTVELREIELRNKPQAMLLISPKGTVPVLQLASGEVLAESLDIMHWAARQTAELSQEITQLQQAAPLIQQNDGEFKYYLDRYKYADRYPELPALIYRQQAERFLIELEQRLKHSPYLTGNYFSLVDAAIAPFIRQFAAVDKHWFATAPYPALQQWLQHFIASSVFTAVMCKYQPWQNNDPPLLFGRISRL